MILLPLFSSGGASGGLPSGQCHRSSPLRLLRVPLSGGVIGLEGGWFMMVIITLIGVPMCLSYSFLVILFFVGEKKQPNLGRSAMVLRRQYWRSAGAVGGRNTSLPN